MVFVGNLPGDIRTREVEDLFYKFGRIIEVSHKAMRLSRVRDIFCMSKQMHQDTLHRNAAAAEA